MSIWYALCEAMHLEFLHMTFMKNALLAVLILAPLFGLLSTMIVTGRMSFFSDALGHSGFTGIAVGVLCGAVQPIGWAVGLAVLFALLFSFVRSRSRQSADTIIGVFSSTAVALGIFIATLGGSSFTKFNKYLIGRHSLRHAGRSRAAGIGSAGCGAFVDICGEPAVSDGGAPAARLLARHSDGKDAGAVHGLHRGRRDLSNELGGSDGH